MKRRAIKIRMWLQHRAGPWLWFWTPRRLIGKGKGFNVYGITMGRIGISIDFPTKEWVCDNCGYTRFREEEVRCWKCGKGEMIYQVQVYQ
jgi:lactate dehydrogenase-like 2-hydroxyacid dehydrogenase